MKIDIDEMPLPTDKEGWTTQIAEVASFINRVEGLRSTHCWVGPADVINPCMDKARDRLRVLAHMGPGLFGYPENTYPAQIRYTRAEGWEVEFRDIPEAITFPGHDEFRVLSQAADCLAAALEGYAINGKPLPTPSAPRIGETMITAQADG